MDLIIESVCRMTQHTLINLHPNKYGKNFTTIHR